MLSRKRCPHTGIVNFYETTDPHVAIGLAMRERGETRYRWLSFADDQHPSGFAADLGAAERSLIQLCMAAADQSALLANAA